MSALEWMAIATAITFSVSFGSSLLLTRPGLRAVLDHPNDRSLHASPTPRTGGLAILAGLLAGGLVYVGTAPGDLAGGLVYAGTAAGDLAVPAVLAVSAVAIIVISLLDDLHRMPAIVRIIVHTGAAVGLLWYASLTIQTLNLPWAGYPLSAWVAGLFSILLLVWFTNLYNFMDGIDGLAAGMGVFGFAGYGVLGLLASAPVFAAFSFIVAGACLGFLGVNFPPARIFMGDVGSSVLGFLAAGFALWADRYEVFPLWLGLLVFSPFVVDATVTLCRRLLKREAFWRAHRSHFYQRLVLSGWSHRRTSLSAYGLMAACGLSAVLAVNASSAVQIGIIIGWALLYLILMIGITRMERPTREAKESSETGTTA